MRRVLLPPAARPPRSDLWLAVARLSAYGLLALWLLRDRLLAWSERRQLAGWRWTSETPPPLEALLASLLHGILQPPVWRVIAALAGLVLLALLGEILLALLQGARAQLGMRLGRGVQRRYRIRLPRPILSGGRRGGADQDLFRAIAGALERAARQGGGQVAWTLTGQANQPVEWGVVIRARRAAQVEQIAALIQATLQGLAPDAQIALADDPLATLPPRSWLAQGEIVLRRPPWYPLRLWNDIESAVLLAPLVAALQPRGTTVLTEWQVIARPLVGWRARVLRWGWRGRALALKLRLEQRLEHGLLLDSRLLETKLQGVPYAVTLRVVAAAHGPTARADCRAALAVIAQALHAYRARTGQVVQDLVLSRCWRARRDQRLRWWWSATPALRRAARPEGLPPLLRLIQWLPPVPVLSSAELGGLWHLPVASLGTLVAWLPNRILPPPPHAFTNGEPDRVMLGLGRRADGQDAPVGPSWKDLRQIAHLTAGMGAGKSRLLANIVQQALPLGVVVIDGKGDDRSGSLVATVRRLVPREAEARLVILDVLDADWPIGLNPLAGVDLRAPGGIDLVLGQVMATFARIDPGTWQRSPGMQQYLAMATLLVLEGESAPTLANVKQCLVDQQYRERLLATARNIEVKTFWEVTYPALGEQQRTSRDALLRRFDLLLTAELTRYLVTQARPTFDFTRAMQEQLIVLVPLPDMTLGGMAGVVGTLIFQAFVRAAFTRDGSSETRADYPLIVDEFQVLLGAGDVRDVETALTRLRSLGIPALYAHQALLQLGPLAELMRINAANRIVLQTQEPDATIYARQYAADGITPFDISQQDPNEHQYVRLVCRGVPTPVFSMRPLPWPAEVPAEVPRPARPLPDWQQTLPPDSPDPELDRQVIRLVYGTPPEQRAALAERLALQLSASEWDAIQARWEAIRQAQRARLLAEPACVPDRLERQLWLSRLLAARPRLLAEIEYYRQRPAILAGAITAPAGRGAPAAPPPPAAWARVAQPAPPLPPGGPGGPFLDGS